MHRALLLGLLLLAAPASAQTRSGQPDGSNVISSVASESAARPGAFALHAAYPNPSSTATALGLDVPEAARVRLAVYDVLGREVAVLLDRRVEAGHYTVRFDGAGLARGVYLVRMQAGGVSAVRRVTLVR